MTIVRSPRCCLAAVLAFVVASHFFVFREIFSFLVEAAVSFVEVGANFLKAHIILQLHKLGARDINVLHLRLLLVFHHVCHQHRWLFAPEFLLLQAQFLVAVLSCRTELIFFETVCLGWHQRRLIFAKWMGLEEARLCACPCLSLCLIRFITLRINHNFRLLRFQQSSPSNVTSSPVSFGLRRHYIHATECTLSRIINLRPSHIQEPIVLHFLVKQLLFILE